MNKDSLLQDWQWHVTRDYGAGSALAAEWLVSELRTNPSLLLSAASGNSPMRTYDLFTRSVISDGVSTSNMRVLKLDEWGGLPMADPATCESYLQKLLIQPLKISPDRFIAFQSDASEPEEECHRIGTWLRLHGPIDICVLGLGINGHLGLNEPAEKLTGSCHLARLTDESLSHSMLSVTTNRPSHGLTMGLREILMSKTILLLVFGAAKATQLERLMTGLLSTCFPALFLTLHDRVVCICEEAAARHLPPHELMTR